MTVYQDCAMTFEVKPNTTLTPVVEQKDEPIKSVMTCPLCGNTAIEIVSRCATCKICGWSVCSA